MGSVTIVLVDKLRIRCLPSLLTDISLHIGPIRHQGAVKPLHLAIGLRTIRPGELMLDILAKSTGKRMRTITPTIISHHPLHRDPTLSEERLSPGPEPRGRVLFLISQDLGIHQTGMIIHARGAGRNIHGLGWPLHGCACRVLDWPAGLGQIRDHGRATHHHQGFYPVS